MDHDSFRTCHIKAVSPFTRPSDGSPWFLIEVDTAPHVLLAHPFWHSLYCPRAGDQVLIYKTRHSKLAILGSVLRYSPTQQRYEFVTPSYTHPGIPVMARLRAAILNIVRKLQPPPKVEPEPVCVEQE